MSVVVGPRQLDRAAAALRRGGLVAFATETVYGLGANALDAAAVARVFEAKGRPHFDPLIVHVADVAAARRLARVWPATAQRLAEAFWPGPLTLVVAKAVDASGEPVVPDLVTAGLGTVALRVPGHALARALIERAGVPVAAPSANRFGGVSPTRAAHVVEELGEAVDVVLDGGPCETGVESTVVSVVGDEAGESGEGAGGVTVLRLGGVAVERIEAVVGPVRVATGAGGEGDARGEGDEATAAARGQASPGMLLRHYAPRTPLVVVDRLEAVEGELTAGAAAVLFADRPELRGALAGRGVAVRVLSTWGDPKEAAAGLFAALRELDAAGAEVIVAERAPEHGLGRAINDRLSRAAKPS